MNDSAKRVHAAATTIQPRATWYATEARFRTSRGHALAIQAQHVRGHHAKDSFRTTKESATGIQAHHRRDDLLQRHASSPADPAELPSTSISPVTRRWSSQHTGVVVYVLYES